MDSIEIKISDKWVIASVGLALLIEGYVILGGVGLQTMGFWFLLYILPGYLILSSFDIKGAEGFVMAIFATAGVIPTLAFYLNYIIPSLRISTFVLFLALMGIALWLNMRKKGKK